MTDRITRSRWVATLIVLAGFLVCLAVNYPGHFTPDSVWQLAQGREGRFNDWHPPTMAWLLGLADHVVPGAGPFMVVDAMLFYGALLAFALLEPRPRPVGLVILASGMVSTIAVIFQGAVLKDVLFADTVLAGFAALAWAGRLWERSASRRALLLLALVLFGLAGLTRQNGLIAPVFGALALSAMALLRGRTRARSVATGAVWLVLALTLVGAATLVLRAHGDGRKEGPHHLKILQVWDLAGAVNREPSLPLPSLHAEAPAVEAFVRRSAAPAYRPVGADNIVTLPDGDQFTNPPGSAAGDDWRRMILTRPGLYLDLRLRVWLDTLLTPSAAQCPMVTVGVDGGSPAMLRRAGLIPRDDDRDDADGDFVAAFLGTPVLSHAAYGVGVLVLLGLAAWRWWLGVRDPGLVVAVTMGLTGLAFTASFFVVSVDCDYRFLYFLDVAAMASAVNLGCARGPRGRR